jgi:hypothetical protein
MTRLPPPADDSADSGWPDAVRHDLLRRLLALALLAGFLLSPRLWLSARAFPLAPVFDWFPGVPAPFDQLWFVALMFLLVLLTCVRPPRWLLPVFLVLAAALAVFDQMRWQPWFYQYWFMLGALAVLRTADGLHVCRFIVAATYFWSGLNKANVSFLDEVYPWLLRPLFPEWFQPFVKGTGYLVPFMEAGVGLGLLARSTRHAAVCAAVAMHAFILASIGPLGHNWNTIVWPWNIAMCLFVGVLFWRTPAVSGFAILALGRTVYGGAVLLLFGVMPVFHFLDVWDSYLSAALYSGNTIQAELFVNEAVEQSLPGIADVGAREEAGSPVDVDSWAMRELNVPGYPARRVYAAIARTLAARAGAAARIMLVIQERPDWRTGKRGETVECFGDGGRKP